MEGSSFDAADAADGVRFAVEDVGSDAAAAAAAAAAAEGVGWEVEPER